MQTKHHLKANKEEQSIASKTEEFLDRIKGEAYQHFEVFFFNNNYLKI